MGDAIGLVIDGAVVPGEAGTYPVTNPVRPAEVVFDAPSASPAQLDRAVAAARARLPGVGGDGPRRAGRGGRQSRRRRRRRRRVTGSGHVAHPGARQGAVGGPVRLGHHRRDGRRLRAVGGRGVGGEVVDRRRPSYHASSTSPMAWWPALLPFNWPVSVLGNKVLPALLAGNTVVVKAPPTCPGAVLAVAAAMAEALPPGVVNAVNGPGPELGETLVAHPGVDMVSFTGGVPTGRAVMAARLERGAAGGPRARRQRRGDRGARRRDRRRPGRQDRRRHVHHVGPGVHGHQAAVRPARQGAAPWWTRWWPGSVRRWSVTGSPPT